jgi:two-component system nitrogen regulation response regulator GlnG
MNRLSATIIQYPQRSSFAPEGGLSATVERHLRLYFDAHENELPTPGLYGRVLQEIERPLLEIVMKACGGNQLRAAELLGLNRNTLRKKLRQLGLEAGRRRGGGKRS